MSYSNVYLFKNIKLLYILQVPQALDVVSI